MDFFLLLLLLLLLEVKENKQNSQKVRFSFSVSLTISNFCQRIECCSRIDFNWHCKKITTIKHRHLLHQCIHQCHTKFNFIINKNSTRFSTCKHGHNSHSTYSTLLAICSSIQNIRQLSFHVLWVDSSLRYKIRRRKKIKSTRHWNSFTFFFSIFLTVFV